MDHNSFNKLFMIIFYFNAINNTAKTFFFHIEFCSYVITCLGSKQNIEIAISESRHIKKILIHIDKLPF